MDLKQALNSTDKSVLIVVILKTSTTLSLQLDTNNVILNLKY